MNSGLKFMLRTACAAYAIAAALLLRQEALHGVAAEAAALAELRQARYGGQEPDIRRALARLMKVSVARGTLEEARALLAGKLAAPDPAHARKLLETVAELPGKVGRKAQFELAELWLGAEPRGDQQAAGLALLRRSADAGEKRAQTLLAALLGAGVRLPRDLRQAQRYYIQAAKSRPEAALALAHLYATQSLPAPNSRARQDLLRQALALFYKNAAAGDQSAMLQLGEIYAGGAEDMGELVPPDLAQATHWYREAIRSGSDLALVKLALLLRDRDGTPDARAQAGALLEQAADGGSGQALLELGRGYRDGVFGPPDPVKALAAFRRTAEQGLSGGMLELANAYLTGAGVVRDLSAGLDWLRRAAAAGSPGAKFEIGMAYRQGRGVARDSAEAYRWFQRAALGGSGSGMAAVSRALEKGVGVAANADESLFWADRALDAGVRSKDLLVRAGNAYATGTTLPQNTAKAIRWLRLAAEKNDSKAMIQLGRLLMLSRSAAPETAIAWFRRAESLGDADALMALGRAYASGFGVPLNERKAFEYFHRASHLGSVSGVREVGNAYAVGFGVPKSPSVALEWYLRAAGLGDTKAMLALHYFYDTGTGAAPDKSTAIAWLRRAADGGNASAQYRLGIALLTGDGLPRDRQEARHHLELAGAKNFQPAVVALTTLLDTRTPVTGESQ